MAKVNFVMIFGDKKIKLKRPSNTTVNELEQIATREFKVKDPSLFYYDEDDLYSVSTEFELTDGIKLEVKRTDQDGKIISELEPLPESKPQPETATERPLPVGTVNSNELPQPDPQPTTATPQNPTGADANVNGKSQPDPPANVNPPDRTVDGSKLQQPPPVPTPNSQATMVRYKEQIETTIQSKHKAQGIAYIVGMSNVSGANVDVRKMETVFSDKLNFAVVLQTNLSAGDLKGLIEAAVHVDYPIRYKYIAFYYAGHGGITAQGHSFVTSSRSPGPNDIVHKYQDIIRVLEIGAAKKCLLFFFDCCMNNPGHLQSPPDLNVDSSHKNCIIANATFFGEKSSGDAMSGGKWTRVLSEKLGEDRELVSILSEVQVEVRGKYNQAATMNNHLTQQVNLKATAKTGGIDLLERRPISNHMDDVLQGYTASYDAIGRHLGVDFATRQAITISLTNITLGQKMSAIIADWLQKTKNPTWKKFIEAMRKNKMIMLANDTESYLKRMPDDEMEKYHTAANEK